MVKNNGTDGFSVKDYLQFQIRRSITNLFKDFLLILEDLQETDYNIADTVYQKYRKRVLDSANDKIREIEEILNNLEILIKDNNEQNK